MSRNAAPSSPEPSTPESPQPLPDSVHELDLEGRKLYLIGTAHVSKKSVEEVRQTIEQVQPDTVCVELCQARYANLQRAEEWKKTDVVKVVRQGKALLLLASLVMASFQRRIGKKLGVQPGAEMAEAARLAESTGARLELVDRDIQITLKRAWASLGWKDRLKMAFHLTGSLFVDEEIDEETIEKLKKEENLQDALEILATAFPTLQASLVGERDTYMAQKLRGVEGETVVAAVGAAHVPGIRENLSLEVPLEPLEEVPPRSVWSRVLQWGIPLLILGLFAYGFYSRGLDELLQSVVIWLLVNGSLSAAGAALAWGHPLSVASAFFAAPLTSLNPLIGAGWVAGLVQALVKRPTVDDLEGLPEAITTVKGFWRNPASRILLVTAFANLGSVAGTFLAGGWIAARSIG